MKCTARSIVGWSVVIGTALSVAVVSTGMAQTRPTSPAAQEPVVRVEVWGYIVADFSRRIAGLSRPPLRVGGRLAFAKGDRRPGRDHKRATSPSQENSGGPSWSAAGRYFLAGDHPGVQGGTCRRNERRDVGRHHGRQHPGEFSNEINGTYPDEKPFSTVPGTILAALPVLPDDVQSRFLGRHLVLLNVRANVILDRIPYAIRCTDCDNGWSLRKEKGSRD